MIPPTLRFTIIDALLLFGIELLLLLFLSSKFRIKQVWSTVLTVNFLKIGILSLLLPTISSIYYFGYFSGDQWYILLLIIGFIISVSLFEKDFGLPREEVIFPAFIITFISSNFWKLLNSDSNILTFTRAPMELMNVATIESEGILQIGLFLVLVFLFVLRKNNPKNFSPTNS